MALSLLLRPMVTDDLDAITALEETCTGGWTRGQLATELKRPGAWQLLACLPADGKIIGYIFGLTVLDEAEIFRLVIASSYRRRGYGGRLLYMAIDKARQLGVKSLFLEVRESNRSALSLYRKAGFSIVGKRGKYYANPLEDAITMRLHTCAA